MVYIHGAFMQGVVEGLIIGQRLAVRMCRQEAAVSERCGNSLGAAKARRCAELLETADFLAMASGADRRASGARSVSSDVLATTSTFEPPLLPGDAPGRLK